MSTDIEVLEIRLLLGNRPFKAVADVKIGDWIIRDFRIIQAEGKSAWVTPPQSSWRLGDGAMTHKTLVKLPDDIEAEVSRAILKRFQEKVKKNDT